MRPRIRTLKPERWHDERIGRVSRDARLLADVLVTFSDDDGRWRHMPVAIMGHGYPYDDDVTPGKIHKWTRELVDAGLVALYEADGAQYGCFPRWHLHQNINRYTASSLPEPPADTGFVRRDDAPRGKGRLTEGSVSAHPPVREGASPPAQARGSGSLPVPDPGVHDHARTRDPAVTRDLVIGILAQSPRLHVDPVGVENALAAWPGDDPIRAARTVITWVSDPAFRSTNAAKLLTDALSKQQQARQRNAAGGRRRSPTADDFLSIARGEAA